MIARQPIAGLRSALAGRDPMYLVSTAVLLILFLAIPEIRAFNHQGALVGSREVIFFELLFIVSVVVDKRSPLPGWRDIPRPIGLLCAVWLGWGLISTMLAEPRLFNTLFSYFGWYVHGLFGLTLWAYLQQYRSWGEWLPGIIVAGFLAYGTYLGYYYIFTEDVPELLWKLTAYGFNHIRHLGYYIVFVIPLAAGLVVMSKYRPHSPLFWFGLVSLSIVWAFVFWAGGRGPLMAIGVSSLLMYPLFRRTTRLKYFIAVMLISVCLGAILSLAMPKGYGLSRIFATVEGSESINQFSSGRLTIWKKCIGDITENPWFGVGPDNYKYNCGLQSPFTGQPHGFHVQSTLDWGLPGAVLFFSLMGLILKNGFSRIKHAAEPLSVNLLGLWGAVTLLALSFVDGTLYYAYPMMFIAAGLALAFQPASAKESVVQTNALARNVYLIVTVITVLVFYVL